jgi:defect-in-organelle-trafficking protein DotC
MMEAAMGAAVQAGARRRYQEIIAEAVLPNAAVLDEMFDFEPLVSRNGDLVVVPPVASGAGAATRIESEASASSQAASFRLARPARLASAVPHWRHYLLELPDGPAETHPSLLPEGAAELGRWRRWVDRGWALGVERAEALFQENVAKLARDYAGMMLFRRLAAGSLASGPVAAETEAGAEAGGSELVLGKKLYRLTETGRFLAPGPPRPPGPGQAEGPP